MEESELWVFVFALVVIVVGVVAWEPVDVNSPKPKTNIDCTGVDPQLLVEAYSICHIESIDSSMACERSAKELLCEKVTYVPNTQSAVSDTINEYSN